MTVPACKNIETRKEKNWLKKRIRSCKILMKRGSKILIIRTTKLNNLKKNSKNKVKNSMILFTLFDAKIIDVGEQLLVNH